MVFVVAWRFFYRARSSVEIDVGEDRQAYEGDEDTLRSDLRANAFVVVIKCWHFSLPISSKGSQASIEITPS